MKSEGFEGVTLFETDEHKISTGFKCWSEPVLGVFQFKSHYYRIFQQKSGLLAGILLFLRDCMYFAIFSPWLCFQIIFFLFMSEPECLIVTHSSNWKEKKFQSKDTKTLVCVFLIENVACVSRVRVGFWLWQEIFVFKFCARHLPFCPHLDMGKGPFGPCLNHPLPSLLPPFPILPLRLEMFFVLNQQCFWACVSFYSFRTLRSKGTLLSFFHATCTRKYLRWSKIFLLLIKFDKSK